MAPGTEWVGGSSPLSASAYFAIFNFRRAPQTRAGGWWGYPALPSPAAALRWHRAPLRLPLIIGVFVLWRSFPTAPPPKHTLLRLLTLAAQKDSGHARTVKAPPSSIRRGRKTSPCQSPFACHHSHHFRQRQMRRLALLSEAAFRLPPYLRSSAVYVPLLYDTFVRSPLPPHCSTSPLHCPLKLLERYLFKIKHFACPANQKFVPALQSANRAAVSKAAGGVGMVGRVGSGSWSGADGMSPKFIIIAYDNSRKEIWKQLSGSPTTSFCSFFFFFCPRFFLPEHIKLWRIIDSLSNWFNKAYCCCYCCWFSFLSPPSASLATVCCLLSLSHSLALGQLVYFKHP